MLDSTKLLALPEVVSLNPRERKVVCGLLSGLSPSQAARAAGYSESTVRRKSGIIAQRGRIRSAIAAAMAAAGINADVLARTIRAALDARTEKGAADWSVRHRFLETALRVGGHEPGPETSQEETYEEQIIRLREETG